ncbi:MAG: NAD-dependent epimerase/dehydratase family protein [Solirubrobacterales bacterium]
MRYLITGGSGYIGGRLIDELSGREETELLVDVDVRPPTRQWPKTEFVKGDVRDRKKILELLRRHEIDALMHFAFILNPIRDEAKMYDIDVNGTQAVLQAASEAGVKQVMVTSSVGAYGAFPDNPKPIAEDWPVRGAPDYAYAKDKADADRICQLWALEHPDRVMTIVRPAMVFGPNVDNYFVHGFENNPFIPLLDGVDEEFQLVHEDDVVSALIALLDGKHDGAFNLAGDGLLTWGRAAELLGKKTRRISLKNMKRLNGLMWRLHVPRTEAPPGNLDFLRYPWVVSTEKLKSTTNWQPRYDTLETFKITMRARGVLPEAPTAVQAPTAPVA